MILITQDVINLIESCSRASGGDPDRLEAYCDRHGLFPLDVGKGDNVDDKMPVDEEKAIDAGSKSVMTIRGNRNDMRDGVEVKKPSIMARLAEGQKRARSERQSIVHSKRSNEDLSMVI